MSRVSLIAFGLTALVKGHSWIHCSDYRGDKAYYDKTQCFGHPRPLEQGPDRPQGLYPEENIFGWDSGHNTQGRVCQSSVIAENSNFPQAVYRRGQNVTLAWPAKNHVAATCTNPFIPDTELRLSVEPQAPEPIFLRRIEDASFVKEPHVNNKIDFKGFQNCPAFCDDGGTKTDKALCTGSFIVPDDLPNGKYSFQWHWEFNAGTEPYVSCFEATIIGSDDPAPAPATTTGAPTTTTNQPVITTTATAATGPAPTDPTTTTMQPDDVQCPNELFQQCDGAHFAGKYCCAAGSTCYRKDVFYSQCLTSCPTGWECDPNGTTVPPPPSTPAPIDAGVCAQVYGQCGGIGWAGSNCCEAGSTCFEQNPHYSQCLDACPTSWDCDRRRAEIHLDEAKLLRASVRARYESRGVTDGAR